MNQVHNDNASDKPHVVLSVLRLVELFDGAAILLETTLGNVMTLTDVNEVRRAFVSERGADVVWEEAGGAKEKIQVGWVSLH